MCMLVECIGLLVTEIFCIKNKRSSHRRCSVRKGTLNNFSKFTGKRLCQSLLFNKVAGLRQVAFKLHHQVATIDRAATCHS